MTERRWKSEGTHRHVSVTDTSSRYHSRIKDELLRIFRPRSREFVRESSAEFEFRLRRTAAFLTIIALRKRNIGYLPSYINSVPLTSC